MPVSSQVTVAPETETKPRIFGLGSIALAGLLGGPLASTWLASANTRVLGLRHQRWPVVTFFALASAVWLYTLLHVPRDLISQLIPHLPQVVLSWFFCFAVFRKPHATHKIKGGAFRSAWAAVGIGLVISVGVRLFSLLFSSTAT